MAKAKPKLIVGQRYYGANNERVLLVSVDEEKKKVEVLPGLSSEVQTRTLAAFHKFIKGSGRRTYLGPKDETRIKLKTEDGEVTYQDLNMQVATVPEKDWNKWRAKVKA